MHRALGNPGRRADHFIGFLVPFGKIETRWGWENIGRHPPSASYAVIGICLPSARSEQNSRTKPLPSIRGEEESRCPHGVFFVKQ